MSYRIQNEEYSPYYLKHYGILGMKWGKQNGPPYPLSRKDAHSSEERSLANRTGTDIGKSSGLGASGGVRKLNSGGSHSSGYSKKSSTSSTSSSKSQSSNNNSSTKSSDSTSKSVKSTVTSAAKTTSEGAKYLASRFKSTASEKVADLRNTLNSTRLIGQNRVDTYLKAGTEFKRVQTSKNFENHAYYATYKKHDTNEYAALFGRNLQRRAAREGNNDQKVYQMTLQAKNKIKVASNKNAANINASLLKNKSYRDDLYKSLSDSQAKMKRPNQLALFQTAKNILRKDPSKLSDGEKQTVYKALNLSLTNHESFENNVQDKFYSAMKKKGYGALVDLNDQSYSSYHAQRPMIIFDTGQTAVKGTRELTNKETEGAYRFYNTERLIKDSITTGLTGVGNYAKYGQQYLNEYFSKSRKSRQRDYR